MTQVHIHNVFLIPMLTVSSKGSVTALNTTSAPAFLRGSAYGRESESWSEVGLINFSFNY